MANFSYEGRDSTGASVSGSIDAPDRKSALRRLTGRGMRVRELSEGRAGGAGVSGKESSGIESYVPRWFGPHPVAQSFFENYRELLAGGLPPGDAVRLMSQRVVDPALRGLCLGLWRDLAEGRSLADALAGRPVLFDEAVVRLVEAGEQSGGLESVANRILEDYERREALRSRVIGAVGYPIFVGFLAMLVLSMFVFVIMPRMESMMHALGGQFPWSVKGIILLATVFVYGAPLLVLGAVFAYPWLRRRRAVPDGRLEQDALLLRIPLLGASLLHADAARLAALISTLLESGLNATDSLRLAERSIANALLRVRFGEVRRRVSDGAAFAVALRDIGIFEASDLDLISVGENAGSLHRAFASIAQRRRRSLDSVLKRLVNVLTAVFLGGAVGLVFFCLLSIVTTIFSVTQSVPMHR